MADESTDNDLGLKLAAENKRLAAELDQVRTRYEAELAELAAKYTDLFTAHQATTKQLEDLASRGDTSKATHADSFTQGLAYALQALQQAPDLPTAQAFLGLVVDDARELLYAVDRAESSVKFRLANGVPALPKVKP